MPRPEWLKIKLKQNSSFNNLNDSVKDLKLNTVCEEALCPNKYECWSKGTATFLIMGDTCTRNCKFCSIKKGSPAELDPDEPERVALAIKKMRISYAVITSVNRDELIDGGAGHWAKTIREIKRINPGCKIEVLVPDFQGKKDSIDTVLFARPDVFAHNLETVPRLYPVVRKKANYNTSLEVLEYASKKGFLTKTGIMVGLGETFDEIMQTMEDAYKRGVKIFTIGQYLQPTKSQLEVFRYITPEEFKNYEDLGKEIGFLLTISGPLVRSSYCAEKAIRYLKS